MANGFRKIPACLYCGAGSYVALNDNVVQCEACGRRMEIARFTLEEEKLQREIESARAAAQQAEKVVRESTQRVRQTLDRTAQQALVQAENRHRALLGELERLMSYMQGSRWRSLQNSFALGDAAQRRGEFDDAIGHYEYVVRNSDQPEAEVHWRIALCSHGVEYVFDPARRRWLPTITHMVMDSLLADENYQTAVRCAKTEEIRLYYRGEAERIERILDKYRVVYSQEKKYDVFISVKQADEEGRPTNDSVTAMKLHGMLTNMGLRVFNSRVSLEKHLGEEYEPYIMAALMSSKMMIVVGHNGEYMNAPWVRSEWRRYRWLKENGGDGRRLVAYIVGMETSETPWELGEFQAINAKYDINPLGTLREVIEQTFPSRCAPQKDEGSNYLERAAMCLRQGDFARADAFCEKALNLNARNARAYVLKLCAELQVRSEQELARQSEPFDRSWNYRFAVECADGRYRPVVEGYLRGTLENIERLRKEEAEEKKRKEAESKLRFSKYPERRKLGEEKYPQERARFEEEIRRREQVRIEEEKRRQEWALNEEDARRQERAKARAEEEKRKQEQARAEEEKRRQERERARAEEEKRRQEQARAEEEKRRQEQARAEEEKRRQEQERARAEKEKRRQEQARAEKEKSDQAQEDHVRQWRETVERLRREEELREKQAADQRREAAFRARRESTEQSRLEKGRELCTAQRYIEAYEVFASISGNPVAQNFLGNMFLMGMGVMQSDSEAEKWFRLSAEQGNRESQDSLGQMLEEGRRAAKNEREAAKWYLLAAEQGDSDAQLRLGRMYRQGRGVGKSDAEAVRWFRAAADQGDDNAQLDLGWMYERGRGVTKNDDMALYWYRQSANQGNENAQFNMGWMFEKGRCVRKNDETAAKWYRLSAEQGNARAQYSLGLMYEQGRGVPKNMLEARRLYSLSAEQGHIPARERLKKL